MANSYTTFPDSVQRFDLKTDVSADIYSVWKQFNTHIANGQFANASALLQGNPELQKCIIDGLYMNKLSKTLEEVEDLFLNKIQTFIHETVIHRGVWNAATKYSKYNFVTYENDGVVQTYECLSNSTPLGNRPTDTTYWVPRVIRGERGESGLGLTPRGSWDVATQYYKNDLVSYNNVLWAAMSDNSGLYPNDSSTVWYGVLSLNIILDDIKISNAEIDAIIDGTAELSDHKTGTI